MKQNIQKIMIAPIAIFFMINIFFTTLFANDAMLGTKVDVSFFKAAKLTSPAMNQLVTGNYLEITWNRYTTVRVRLDVYDYTHEKFLFRGNVNGLAKEVTLPNDGDARIVAVIYSYDANGKYIGYDRTYVNKKLRAATITSPKTNTQLTDGTLAIEWKKNLAENIILYIYDFRTRKAVYYDAVPSTRKTFARMPKHGGKLLVIIYSFDEEGNYIGKDKVVVITKNRY